MADVTGHRLYRHSAQRVLARLEGLRQWLLAHRRQVETGLLIALAFIGFQLLLAHVRTALDDLRYGRPRTMQISAFVQHHEGAGVPTHFIAVNLNRRVVVIEFPGGDPAKARILQGPYLFGAHEDLTPVRLRSADANGDGKPELIVSVKNEEIVYINEGETFRLITDEERRALSAVGQSGE